MNRKILVLYIADHPFAFASIELCEQNEEEGCHDAEVLFVSPKNI